MSTQSLESDQHVIEDVVRQRAVHTTAEDVQVTCSFARAEQLLGREYHGRFLIELLQNAADAWRQQAAPGQRSPVRVVVEADGRAVVVANHGAAFPAQVVLTSLGHLGRSTKHKGEAIGHKGIGFKSVLEVSSTPELYSALDQQSPGLAVRFDAAAALEEIKARSTGWALYLPDVEDMPREIDAVPVLRFPRWVDQPPPVVAELAAEGFTTVVRLPYSGDGHADEWLAVVRRAFEQDVTDQVLLLLGTFNEVVFDDRHAGTRRTVAPLWRAQADLPAGVSREEVVIERDGEVSSSWFLYRQGAGGLAGETAVGVRVQRGADGPPAVVSPMAGDAGSPFHLFFPTRIASGMPLLLHGYFEVDAARTGFYDGEGSCNAQVLDALVGLSVRAVDDLAATATVDLVSMVELFAATTVPDDPQARRTRAAVLAGLDAVEWVPLAPGGEGPRRARPADCLLTWDDRLDDALLSTFPAWYMERSSGRRVPHRELSAAGRALLRARRPPDEEQGWTDLGVLLRPGPASPWPVGGEDAGFRSLLDLVTVMQALDRKKADDLLGSLRGDPRAQLLPVPQPAGGRRLYPLPAPAEGVRGRRSALVMGRVRAGGTLLQPPEAMDVVFLRDGLLANEADGDRAKPLGVRPFTVDTVLDRLSAVRDAEGGEVITFLWTLLARAREHEAGTAAGSRLAGVLDPAQWFWCQPGRGDLAESDRAKQRRQRRLAEVRLPAQDGTWRPAGTLAFGGDWSAWLEGWAQGDHATVARAEAYRALSRVAPEAGALLGPPEEVLALLPALSGLQDDDANGAVVEVEGPAHERERLAFLLRLGVWEVLPVQAHDDREGEAERPWADLREQLRPGVDATPWVFDGAPSALGHLKVRVSEDFRFGWPLAQPDVVRRQDVSALLSAGASLYARLTTTLAFCRGCGDGGRWHTRTCRTGADDRGVSTLALQLAESEWIPTERAAVPQPAGSRPSAVWWAEDPPTEAGMPNSPLRFLPLLHREAHLSEELRRLCGITDLEHSPLGRLADLLRSLRDGVESGVLPGPGGGRQALVGLHRLAYGRLKDLDGGAAVLRDLGVLCELNGTLVVRPPAESRHDDDRYSIFRRHFSRVVPFVVLARDKSGVARGLELPAFEVSVRREGDELGTDVTAELSDALAERLPELFAVLVHHSLGAQTLEPTSLQFDTRSRRLRALVVRQVQDLVLHVEAVGTGHTCTLGHGSVQDLFLEGASTPKPVLYHDLSGTDWHRRLRTRLAGHLAALVENTAYTATFQLLLLAEDDAERERVLHDLGISHDDVQEVRRRLGAVSELDRRAERAWRRALLRVLSGAPADPGTDPVADLRGAGLASEVAEQVAAGGSGQAARSDSGPVLRLLHHAGVDLAALHRVLREDGDPGLDVRAATEYLRGWKDQHGRWLVAVLALAGTAEDTARAGVDGLAPPPDLALVLDPEPALVLVAAVRLLQTAGLDPDAAALVADPRVELVRLARLSGPDELDERVEAIYVDEERRRVLERMAAAWRRELTLLGTLARAGVGETRAVTRVHHETVLHLVPSSAGLPSALRSCLPDLLPGRSGAQELLEAQLVDSVTVAPPDRGELLEALAGWLPVQLADAVQAAIAQPVKDLVRHVRDHVGRLAEAGLVPVVPAGLVAPGERPRRSAGPRTVARVTVDVSVDRRKKQLGDEGESWAFASVVGPLLTLAPAARAEALDEVVALMCKYAKGAAVEAALTHRAGATSPDADAEDLVADLAGLLHVSRHGDGFGYDLLGWLPPEDGAPPQAVALEVKSSADGGFLLSRNEWGTARRFADGGDGDAYAVLVVRRGAGRIVPARLDLLRDPMRLVESRRLSKEEDTYRMRYALGLKSDDDS